MPRDASPCPAAEKTLPESGAAPDKGGLGQLASGTKESAAKKKRKGQRQSKGKACSAQPSASFSSSHPIMIGCSVDELPIASELPPAKEERMMLRGTNATLETAVGAHLPSHLPSSLPFHFRLDVSSIRLAGNGGHVKYPDTWQQDVASSLEVEWKSCREQQEQAWLEEGKLPLEITQALAASGVHTWSLVRCLRRRQDMKWESRKSAGPGEITPMKVLRLERAPGVPLQKQDLEEVGFDGLWCQMLYDICDDPLLAEMGYQGPTQFVALLLAYESPLNPMDFPLEQFSREVRFAHIDHFEFAICCPASPYSGCRFKEPHNGICRLFCLDVSPGSESLQKHMIDARAALTWLFWDCFDQMFPHGNDQKQAATTWRQGKRLRDCETRSEALATILATMRAQPFLLPFRCEVSRHHAERHRELHMQGLRVEGCDGDLLAAVELAFQEAAAEYHELLEEIGPDERHHLLPKQWYRAVHTNRWPIQMDLHDQSRGSESFYTRVSPLSCEHLQLAAVQCVGIMFQHDEADADRSKGFDEKSLKPGLLSGSSSRLEIECEQKHMDLTMDLSKWESSGVVSVGDIHIDDHHLIGEVLAVVQQLDEAVQSRRTRNSLWQVMEKDSLEEVEANLAQLAYGLRALQRASLKFELRSVGLAVLEAERAESDHSVVSVASAAYQEMSFFNSIPSTRSQQVQRVLLLSAPERVLQQRAEAQNLLRTVLPNGQDNLLCGGFVAKQFDRGGPLQRFWLESRTSQYLYSPYFKPPCQSLDPSALLSPAERTYLVKSFITDPKRYLLLEDGNVDLRQGGAQMDPRQLQADNIIEGGLLRLHSPMALRELESGIVFPWQSLTWQGYLRRGCTCNTELLRQHFGPQVASYFDFLNLYSQFLLIAAIFGLIAFFARSPNEHADASFPSPGFWWRLVRPTVGVGMSVWGMVFCIVWRRRAAWLTYSWDNGWTEQAEDLKGTGAMETTGRVRPEFALSWRKNFQKATLQKQRRVLNRLRRLLRAPYSGQGANFFTDRVLKADIWRFDEACYQSYWVHLRRQVLASCVSVFFILLACGATFGSLAINDEFELNPWVAYVLSGMTSSVLVPLLGYWHQIVVLATNEYQLFRYDHDKERDVFNRLFGFALFNTYNSLLWIAFYKRNMDQLQIQVMFLTLSHALVNNVVEFYSALWRKQIREVGKQAASPLRHTHCCCMRRFLYIFTGDAACAETRSTCVEKMLEQVSEQLARDRTFQLVQELIELVIQYGMVVMFTLAFPLTPCIALLGCHLENRVDCYRLIRLARAPEPRMVVGIGQSFNAFLGVTGLGMLVSGFLVNFTWYDAEDCVEHSRTCKTVVDLVLSNLGLEKHTQLYILAAGEHCLLMIMFLLYYSDPTSLRVQEEKYRQQFFEKRMALEFQDIQGLQPRLRQRRAHSATNDAAPALDAKEY